MKRLKCACRRVECRERFNCTKPRSWYAAFSHDGTWYGQSLRAGEFEERTAIKELGKLIEKAERGGKPSDLNKTFKNAVPFYLEWCRGEGEKSSATIKENLGRIDKWLIPYFGKLAIKDITKGAVKLYKVDREESGSPKDTIVKELRVIKEVCQLFNPSFELPKFKRWANRGKKVHSTLSYSEVMQVAERCLESSVKYGETYRSIFLLMAYTGLDIGDVVSLERSQITKDGFILKDRGKSQERICAYLWEDARKLLADIKITGISGRFFNVPGNKAVTTAVLRAFKKENIRGNSKALRHLASSVLFNAGVPDAVVKKFIGHSKNSRQTDVYSHADKHKIEQGFQGFKALAFEHKKHFENGREK